MLVNQHKNVLFSLIESTLSESVINRIARETDFMKRVGKVPPSHFLNTLLFNEQEMSKTSLPDLTADLKQTYGIDISKEALHKKFSPNSVRFMKSILSELLSKQLAKDRAEGLQLCFPRIKIKDSTKFSLPDSYGGDYKGYGNYSKKNGMMSLQYEYDLVSGNWLSLQMTKGLRNDQQDSKETLSDITKGDLHIRDLGYVTPVYLSALVEKEAFFLNRLPPQAGVFTMDGQPLDRGKIMRKFNRNKLTAMELLVMVYDKNRVPCRLVIETVDDEEYGKRLEKARMKAKSRKVGITESHKKKLRLNTYITNVNSSILPITAIRKTYYLRWQVELIFKTWKSVFAINKIKKVKKERLECHLLAKLMWILINYRLFNTCNAHVKKQDNMQGMSVLIFFKRCRKFAASLKQVLLKRKSISTWLKQVYLPLISDCLCVPPRKKQTHYESLKINIKALG